MEGGREGGITPQPGTVRVWPHNCRLEPRLTRAAQNHAYKRLKLLIIIIILLLFFYYYYYFINFITIILLILLLFFIITIIITIF